MKELIAAFTAALLPLSLAALWWWTSINGEVGVQWLLQNFPLDVPYWPVLLLPVYAEAEAGLTDNSHSSDT